MSQLSPEEFERYARHLALKEVGEEGQLRLKSASVLLIGTGGLGSPLALYLAAAGVGRLGLVEFDVVDRSNLQRQVLHGESFVGRPKLESAQARLREINPHVKLDLLDTRLTSDNAEELFRRYDIVADGTDNFPTRYLSNDAGILTGRPVVSAAIYGFEGQLSVFGLEDGPCYRCLYPTPPPPGSVPSCAEGGVLGVLPGVMGSLQAMEVLKLILGIGEPASGKLLVYNALDLSFQTLKFKPDPHCLVCGPHADIIKLIDYEQFCGVKRPDTPEITTSELADQLPSLYLLDVREPYERQAGRIADHAHIPLNELAQQLSEIPREANIVIYCQSGKRSASATATLLAAGYSSVRSLTGGFQAWQKSQRENS